MFTTSCASHLKQDIHDSDLTERRILIGEETENNLKF